MDLVLLMTRELGDKRLGFGTIYSLHVESRLGEVHNLKHQKDDLRLHSLAVVLTGLMLTSDNW